MRPFFVGEDIEENRKREKAVERMERRLRGLDNIMRICSVDLAQTTDYTGISILERVGNMSVIRHLERLDQDLPYPDQVSRIQIIMRNKVDRLVIDRTGIGAPVFDLLRQAGLKPIGISITGGDSPTFSGSKWNIPKKDLIGALLVAFEQGTIKIAPCKDREALISELQAFEIQISKNGHPSFNGVGEHDDLVMSVAMNIYASNRLYKSGFLNFEDAKGYGGISQDKEPLSYMEQREKAMRELYRKHKARIYGK